MLQIGGSTMDGVPMVSGDREEVVQGVVRPSTFFPLP